MIGIYRRFGRWIRGQKIFLCPECNKRWPRTAVIYGEICGGTHLHPHPTRLMKRTRQTWKIDEIELVATAFRWDY